MLLANHLRKAARAQQLGEWSMRMRHAGRFGGICHE
jgi:hypothetical protein